MDVNNLRKLEIMPKIKPLEFLKQYIKNLNCSLVIPSRSNSYSICIEFMKEWFRDGFVDGYFKSEYIDGKHVLDDFKSLTRQQLIKRNKPALSIIPRADNDFNRENIDLYNMGTALYNNRCRFSDAFFVDEQSKSFISIDFKLLKMNFTYRIKVDTLAQAQDLFDFINIRYRANGTQGKYCDIDFHVPTDLMNKLAMDNGFDVKNGQVVDTVAFLYYLNSHSQLPFMYKLRASTGNYQYFIKLKNMYIHIRSNQVSIDDGERQGQLMTNYIVEFEAEVRFPAPKFYAYYGVSSEEYIKCDNIDGSYNLYSFPMSKIPVKNNNGWPQYMTTDYEEDNDNYLAKKPLVIEFNSIMSDLRKCIDFTKGLYLSPSLFIEIKLFNESKEIETEVDWDNYLIKTKEFLPNKNSFLVFYVDLAYFNETSLKLRDNEDKRVDTEHLISKQFRN